MLNDFPKPKTRMTDPSRNPNEPSIGDVDVSTHNQDLELTRDTVDKILQRELSPVHRTDPNVLRFISAYIDCRDYKQAAKMIGLTGREGRVLFDRRDIYTAIKKITDLAIEKYGYDAAEAIEKTKEIGFIDPAECQNPDGSWINKMVDMPPGVRRAIKELKVKNLFEKDANGIDRVVGEIIEIKFHDKMRALELLGREKDLFVERKVTTHEVGRNMRDVLLQSTRRGQEALESIDVTPKQIEHKDE